MPRIDELPVPSSTLNTGTAGTDLNLKRIKDILITPTSTEIDDTFRATPRASIKALLLADSGVNRSYLLPVRVAEVTDNSTETKRLSFTYGHEISIYYGTGIHTYHPVSVDQNVLEAMQVFNHRQADYKVFIIDEDDQLIGTKYVNDDSETVIKGFTAADIHTDGMKFDVGEGVKYGMRVVYANPKEFNNGNLMVFPLGFDAESLPRMNTLTLSQKTAITTRVVDVKVMVGKTNFGDTQWGSLLAVVGAWKGTKDSDGSALTVTAVSKLTVSGDTVYRITYSATNFPSSAATLTVNLQLPSVLAALTSPLEGFESGGGLSQTVA